MSSSNVAPPCRILFRSKKAAEIYTVPEPNNESSNDNKSPITLAQGIATMHSFSDDGTKLLLFMPSAGVKLVDMTKTYNQGDIDKASIVLENSKGVQFMAFSSLGTYILTWERPMKIEGDSNNTNPPPNLKVWSSVSGRYLHGFSMKGCKRDQWPPVRWSYDEKFAFHQVTNQLDVYDGKAFSEGEGNVKLIDRIRCNGLSSFSMPTQSTVLTDSNKYIISTFVGETKGKPARVSLMRYPDRLGTSENPKSGNLLVSKSFYQAEDCTVNWSPQGDAALMLTTTSVDSSGESYYGSTNLYLLLSDNKTKGMDGEALSVPLPGGSGKNSGPVLDVAWMPNPNKPSAFAVISGRMPAMGSLHHGTTAEPTFLFGNAHRNTIVWSDHGRFLTLGGFGNLAGGMDFYDRNKMKAIPQFDPNTGADLGSRGNTASCAVGYGWSPSSRYFMVSTTSPRMNVDNGVALYKYNGLEIRDKAIVTWDNSNFVPDQLYAAEFVPSKAGVYPDRAQTPPPKRSGGDEKGNAGSSAVKTAAAPAAYVPPAGRYVPPSARKAGGGMSLADRMRKEREGSAMGVTKVVPGSTPGTKGPIGMTNVEGGKSKSALRKERQKLAKKKAEEEAKAEEERKAREEKERLAAAKEDPVKRTKKLKKILKQIDELKAKDQSALNDDQKKKLASEEEVRKELESLSTS